MGDRFPVVWRLSWCVGVQAVLPGTLACQPTIDRFTVTPATVCTGDRVDIRWKADGNAQLTVSPPQRGAPDGDVPSEGRATIAPTRSTRVQLRVSRFLSGPTSAVADVQVREAASVPEPLTQSLSDPSAGCDPATVWATVHAANFDASVRVARVSSHDGRTYEVEHAGHHAALAPGAVSADFAGDPVTGDWTLRSTLREGERCGSASLPPSLTIDVYTQCGGGGR